MILRAVGVAMVIVLLGCQSGPPGPYAGQTIERRDTAKASSLNRRAADIIYSDPDTAEKLLREALSYDLHFGPAHNNLGILFLSQGNLYEASSEFEWARKLMPGHPDPRLNLAITLERGGQVEEAIATYQAVLDLRPEFQPAMIGLASLQLRHLKADEHTQALLDQIAAASSNDQIRNWARMQINRLQSHDRIQDR
ncbi:MAG TPA: tetratricopeptide repeat protein [Phycisphaerales bacterium]|nr:tetratricopeptide repeat protein [Phycisphaerales bacterium]